jgi:hypothetical protein
MVIIIVNDELSWTKNAPFCPISASGSNRGQILILENNHWPTQMKANIVELMEIAQ